MGLSQEKLIKGLIIQDHMLINVLTHIMVTEAKHDSNMALLILRALNNFLLQNGHILIKSATIESSECNLFEFLRVNLLFVLNKGEYKQ